MVVSHRVPVPPATPVSRTTSSQPLARAAKGKAPQTVSNPSQSSSNQNGESREPPIHGYHTSVSGSLGGASQNNLTDWKESNSRKGRNKRPHRDKRNGLSSSLLAILLAILTLYTFSVCPTEQDSYGTVCRGVSEYKRLFIEPVIVRPIQAALSHPSVAPYLAHVEPHVTTVIQTAKPVALSIHTQWNALVLPQWNKHVVPQWNKHVVPRWNKHVTPHIHHVRSTLEPYRSYVATGYNNHVAPNVEIIIIRLQRWQHDSQPYIILATSKCRDSYHAMKPYALPIWRQLEAVFMQLLGVVRAQRRQFVDPHVARIWEKVKELSSGKPKAVSSVPSITSLGSSASALSSSVTTSQSSTESTTASHTSSSSETPQPANSDPSVNKIPEAASTADVANESTSSVLVDVPVVSAETPEETLTPETLEEPTEFTSLVASTSPVETLSTVPTSSSEEPHSSVHSDDPPSSTQGQEDDPLDENLREFYVGIGMEDDPGQEPTTTKPAPPLVTETEEEKRARIRREEEDVANRRTDIMRRHSNWEVQMEALIKTKRKELRKALVAIRKSAVADLKESSQVKGHIEAFVAEAEKYLKGVEMSLKSLTKDSQNNQDKFSLWTRVVKKVEGKFTGKTRKIEAVVNDWYSAIVVREIAEVQNAHETIRMLGEEAQADLGMDYAWLDDVTYQDWQRYHDLIRKVEEFADQASSIQNGTHPSPPINPVLPAMQELQSELQDIINGFDTRLSRIKRDGERAFSAAPSDDATGNEKPAGAEFSILPVPDKENTAGEPGRDIPPVIMSRSKEQVSQALENAREQAPLPVKGHDAEGKSPAAEAERVPVDRVEL